MSLLLHGLLSGCGELGLLSSCAAWASHCGGFSLLSTVSRAQAPGVAARGLSDYRPRYPVSSLAA